MSESAIKAAREFWLTKVGSNYGDERLLRAMTTFAQKVADEQTADLRNRLEALEKFVGETLDDCDYCVNVRKARYKELQEATKDEASEVNYSRERIKS